MPEYLSPRWTHSVESNGSIAGVPELLMLGFDEPRTALPLEYHDHNGYEFVLVERGSASWELEGSVFETRAGDVFYTGPGEVHRGGFNVIEPSRFCWLIITPPHSSNWLLLPQDESNAIKQALERLPRVFHAGLDPIENFQRLRKSIVSSDPLRSTAIRLAIQALLLQFLMPNQPLTSMSEDLRNQFDRLLKRMDTEPAWRPSVEEMAAFVHISPSHFFRMFQEYTGFAPMAYVERSRVKKASRLLLETSDSVTDISGELGYANSQHFATAFKRITGMTPLQWRKSQRETSM